MTAPNAIQRLRDWHDSTVVHPDDECDFCRDMADLDALYQAAKDVVALTAEDNIYDSSKLKENVEAIPDALDALAAAVRQTEQP